MRWCECGFQLNFTSFVHMRVFLDSTYVLMHDSNVLYFSLGLRHARLVKQLSV